MNLPIYFSMIHGGWTHIMMQARDDVYERARIEQNVLELVLHRYL